MKNRKIAVVAFMLAAVMLLGFGFAQLTDELTVDGHVATDISASQDSFDSGLFFASTTVVRDDTVNKAGSAIDAEQERDVVTITAKNFTTEGQKVVISVVIKNADTSDFSAKVTPDVGYNVTVNNHADHDPIFAVTWSWSQDAEDNTEITLNPGESKEFFVTITLTDVPDAVHTADFTIKFNAVGTRYEAPAVEGE